MVNENNEDLAGQLKQFRSEIGYSLSQISKKSGIPHETLKNWSNGTTKTPQKSGDLIIVACILSLDKLKTVSLLRAADYSEIAKEFEQSFEKVIDKVKEEVNDAKLLERLSYWTSTLKIKKNTRDMVRQVLSAPEVDYLNHLENLSKECTPQEIENDLRVIAFDITENSVIRARALRELVSLNKIESDDWTKILQQTDTELLEEILHILSESKICLSEEHLKVFLANTNFPNKTTGLGSVIIKLIRRGGYTSAVFETTVATRYRHAWEVKYDCIKSIIKLDDEDSVRVLAKFKRITYWQPRQQMAEYFLKRSREGRLSVEEKEMALELVTKFLTDGYTRPRTPSLRLLKEAQKALQGEMQKA